MVNPTGPDTPIPAPIPTPDRKSTFSRRKAGVLAGALGAAALSIWGAFKLGFLGRRDDNLQPVETTTLNDLGIPTVSVPDGTRVNPTQVAITMTPTGELMLTPTATVPVIIPTDVPTVVATEAPTATPEFDIPEGDHLLPDDENRAFYMPENLTSAYQPIKDAIDAFISNTWEGVQLDDVWDENKIRKYDRGPQITLLKDPSLMLDFTQLSIYTLVLAVPDNGDAAYYTFAYNPNFYASELEEKQENGRIVYKIDSSKDKLPGPLHFAVQYKADVGDFYATGLEAIDLAGTPRQATRQPGRATSSPNPPTTVPDGGTTGGGNTGGSGDGGSTGGDTGGTGGGEQPSSTPVRPPATATAGNPPASPTAGNPPVTPTAGQPGKSPTPGIPGP